MNDPVVPQGVLAAVSEQLLLNMIEAQSKIEAQARALEDVRRNAEIDPLTRLPNRVLLLDRCARAIASAQRNNRRLAILFLDIDNFKLINDRGGHAAGDQALRSAARRLLSAVRAIDTVSRFGGDEFVILITEIAVPSDAALIAAKVIAALAVPDLEAPGLRVSLGISIYPDNGLDPQVLISLADAAMYGVKETGGGTWRRSTMIGDGAAARGETMSAPRAQVFEPRADPATSPTLRIRDGSYRFDLRAHGYQTSGSATKHGHRLAVADGACRFSGDITESGVHLSATVTVRLDEPDARNLLVEESFTMQMDGVVGGAGFSLLGLGPHGVIIEIHCSGPVVERSGPEGLSDENRAA